MKISIAQINPIVGDFDYNIKLIKEFWNKAEQAQSDIIIFPELSVCGYNPQDLALRDDFINSCTKSVEELLEYSKSVKVASIIGSIRKEDDHRYNSAFLIKGGQILHIHDKLILPNYSVFDEKRLFSAGKAVNDFLFNGYKSAILICEDVWDENLVKNLSGRALEYIFVINASPYTKTKSEKRNLVIKNLQETTGANIIYVNQVGLQDSVLYDGSSKILDNQGNIIFEASSFVEEFHVITSNSDKIIQEVIPKEEEIYNALVFSLKDYLRKNNLKTTIIGFSSGIDSSLTAVLSFDAIGKENTKLVSLPTKFNSKATFKDEQDFAKNNDVIIDSFGIDNIYNDFLNLLNIENSNSITSQNLQSRIRGVALMAIANSETRLLLSTGNKSEMATGYATIYGDMNGGYNLLKDLYKTEIYKLAKWRNNNLPKNSQHNIKYPIPKNIIDKEPTAELSYGQKDSDSLPSYDVLDKILFCYIDKLQSRGDIIKLGYAPEIVDHVLNLVRIAQFKRYQSTMGPKISDMSFDLDWRYPITNKFY